MPERQHMTYEQLKEQDKMCLTTRLHIRFTTWQAFKRAILQAEKHGDKQVHGEIIVELR